MIHSELVALVSRARRRSLVYAPVVIGFTTFSACANADKRDEAARTAELVIARDEQLSLAADAVSHQREFFTLLFAGDPRAREFIQEDFRTYDDSLGTYLDWSTTPFAGHDTASLALLAARLPPVDRLNGADFEVLQYSHDRVVVIGLGALDQRSMTGWELKQGSWQARGLRVRISDRSIEFARNALARETASRGGAVP